MIGPNISAVTGATVADGDTLTSGTSVALTNVTSARAGANGTTASTAGRAYVIPFQLPTLAAGDSFTAASLSVFDFPSATAITAYPNGTTATFNADLYGLPVSTSSAVTANMYFEGARDTTNATLVQDNFSTPGTEPSATTPLTTSTAGSAALVAYLNAAYANGANAGQFVFLRLNADADPGTAAPSNSYVYDTFDNGTTTIPAITFSTALTSVPEPTSLAVVGGAAVVGLVRRRRVTR